MTDDERVREVLTSYFEPTTGLYSQLERELHTLLAAHRRAVVEACQAKLREMRHEKRAQAQAAYDQYRMETFREAEHHAVAFNDAQLALEPLKEGEG